MVQTQTPKRTREVDIDHLKGLAITLVVLGHLTAGSPVPGNRWIEVTTDVIYLFHMPLFMFLSGLVWFMRPKQIGPDFGDYVTTRAKRLLIPFVLFGLFVLVGKLAAQQVIHVDNKPQGLLGGLRDLVWTTSGSPSAGLWYLFTLFIYSVTTPLLLRFTRGRVWPLVLVAAIVCLWKFPEVAYLNRITANAVFFWAGGLVVEHMVTIRQIVDRYPARIVILGLATLSIHWIGLPERLVPLLVTFPVTLALFTLVRHARGIFARSLGVLAATSFSIYLLNTVAIGVTKGAWLQVGEWGGPSFPVLALAMMLAGILVPIATRLWVFSRVPILDRYTA